MFIATTVDRPITGPEVGLLFLSLFSTSPNLLLLQSGFSDVNIDFQVLQYASPSTILFELVSDPNEDDTLFLIGTISWVQVS